MKVEYRIMDRNWTIKVKRLSAMSSALLSFKWSGPNYAPPVHSPPHVFYHLMSLCNTLQGPFSMAVLKEII